MNDLPWATGERYDAVARAFHWGLAAALVANFLLGLYMSDLPFSPQRLKLFNWHKWAGISILVLSFLRLMWRWRVGAPALPPQVRRTMAPWQSAAHHAVHGLMYAAFFVVPLSGWAYSSAAGFPVVWFGVIPLPDWVPVDRGLAALLKEGHELASYGLAGLVLVHLAAVVKHQWIDRDGLLDRMRGASRTRRARAPVPRSH